EDLKAALIDWVRELAPTEVVDIDFPADQIGRVLLTLVEPGGRRISAYSASDGTLRFLAIAASLLSNDAMRLYVLEELDIGIHPTRLHLLLQLIEQQVKTGKVQVLATTHSPQLLELLSQEARASSVLAYRDPESRTSKLK